MIENNPLKKILILNDDRYIINEILLSLQDKEKFDIRVFLSNQSVKNSIPHLFIPQYAIIDYKLVNESGLESLQYLRNKCKYIFIIVTSSTLDSMDSFLIKENHPSLYFNFTQGDITEFFLCLKTIIKHDQMRNPH